MVEVFKTNVEDRDHAATLIAVIQKEFADYSVNFDLEDCDKILRIECNSGHIHAPVIIDLLEDFGVAADILQA